MSLSERMRALSDQEDDFLRKLELKAILAKERVEMETKKSVISPSKNKEGRWLAFNT